MTPKISIILPVFNAEHTVINAIDSIIHQHFSDWELVVVDDGSTDDTANLLKTYHDARIFIHTTQHRGIAKALNFGLKLARATVIARMDADDISLPERLSKQYDVLIKNNSIGVVASQVTYHGDRCAQHGYALYVDEINRLIKHQQMYLFRFQDSPVAHPSVMFRKSLIEQYGGYTEAALPEDYELWLRWMHHDIKFYKLPYSTFVWNDKRTRASRVSDLYSSDKFYYLKAKYLSLHFKKKNSKTPELWVWGTGRLVNKHTRHLKLFGLQVSLYIDVKKVAADRKNVMHYSQLTKPAHNVVILSYVRDRVGKRKIKACLEEKNYVEGEHFFMLG